MYAFPASQPIPWPQVAFTQVNISVCLTFGPSLVSLRLKRRGYNYRKPEIQVKKERQTDESMEGWKGREKEWNENCTREGIRATGMEGEGLEEECRMELREQIMKQTHQRLCRRGGGGMVGLDPRHILRDR
jgi:hypothetical protein